MRRRPVLLVAAALVVLSACGGAPDDQPVVAAPAGDAALADLAPGTTAAPSTTAASTTTVSTTTSTPAPAPTGADAAVVPDPRLSRVQGWEAFASTGGLVLRHPSAWVERIGFHQSNHDGAQALSSLPSAVAPTVMAARGRGTTPAGAADIVVQPGTEIRAPVTGRVLRASDYVLYCDTPDEYLVLEPDDHPGWEVKVLHVQGLLVERGDRVEAGVTPVARQAHQLPFESQVDELRAADPAWPHVHVEVVDPSIPDRPSPGGGCQP